MNLKDIKFPPIHLMIAHFFGRFHIVTFTVVVIGGLAAVTYFLNEVIISSSEKETQGIEQAAPGFDQATIDRVNGLKESSGEIQPLTMPAGQRSNPFTE